MATTITLPAVKRAPQYGDKETYVRLIHKGKSMLGEVPFTSGEIYDEDCRQAILHIIGAHELLTKLCEKYPL
jgi:hypothetical protein